jgi:hypothetical protein
MSATAPDEGSILADLAVAGFVTASISDLRRSGLRYRDAIPVLLEWLARVADPRLKGELVRALSVPWAKPAAIHPLVDQYRLVDDSLDPTGMGLRWTIGNALEVLFDDAAFDAYVELVRDERYGKARQMVVLGLGKSKRPEAVHVLMSLLDDPDIDGHVVKALGRLNAPTARPALEAKLNDKRAWVRGEARKALARLPG